MGADRWHVGAERTEHLAILLGEVCLTGRLQIVGKVSDVRMLLVREGVVEREDSRNAGISLFAREDSVREHQDLSGLGGQIPPLFGKAIEDGLKRPIGGFGRKVSAPMTADLTRLRPGVRVEDMNATLFVWIDDELRQFGSHAVQAFDDRQNGTEVRLLADDREARVLDHSASTAVNFLPVVPEESELRGALLP